MKTQNVKVPTQAQIDSGKPPSGWHFELDSDGVALVRNGHHLVELPEGITSAPGEYARQAFHTLPPKEVIEAMMVRHNDV